MINFYFYNVPVQEMIWIFFSFPSFHNTIASGWSIFSLQSAFLIKDTAQHDQ